MFTRVLFFKLVQGFYRVNYDERNWNLIWAQLLHDPKQIPTISRAELIDDAFHLARADLLPYRTALNLANYLRKETEYLPWRSAFDVFQYIDAMLTRMPSTYEAFKVMRLCYFENAMVILTCYLQQFIVGILAPLYEQLTVIGQTDGDDLSTLRLLSEATKWACRWDQKDCVEMALVVYREWMARPNDPEVIVPADLKRVITCTAVRHLNWTEWQFAWTKFQESNIQTEKSDLLNGMACTTNTSLLST
jgi:aminopeptidase N